MTNTKIKLMCSVAFAAGILASGAHAQSGPVLVPGDAVVTGFSGIAPITPAAEAMGIDLDGPSAQVLSLAAMPGAPSGSMTTMPAKLRITAREVGQVFAIALDKGVNGSPPSIYLGATSLFGLQIVEGSGNDRLENGEAGAKFMDGQFGPGGSPGSIWKIDGATGEITEFAKLPGNSGPGVGDVVYDAPNRQFFATDLDTGLIYRISADGAIIETFDHGVNGRVTAGLAAVDDDGTSLDITNPAFDTNNPETWGYTQKERRVFGLAISNGRLYYASEGVPQQVWSIGLTDTGGFAGDATLEFNVEGLAGNGPITDMLFDKSGKLYLSQRGPQKASFNFSEFATPGQASVLRYRQDDSGNWVAEPDIYAIGMPPEHKAANGGIALGFNYDESGMAIAGTCDATLWSTGGRLVSSNGAAGSPADVHGLQGNAVSLTMPKNVPPVSAYFVDYDGLVGDAYKAGHMGDVEVFQPCATSTAPQGAEYPPGFYPPGNLPPDGWPPIFPPPTEPFNTNLRLTKKASPRECLPFAGGWSCQFSVRVRNTGPDRYFGDILVKDTLPAAPAGAFFGVGPVPPWSCWTSGAAQLQCWRPGVILNPGQYVELKVNVWLPNTYDRCRVRNIANIEWAPGGTRWNTDPTDDHDGASARVPLPVCAPAHIPAGSLIHRPRGSVVHRPIGSNIHRPRGSIVHRPRGSIVHRPIGSNIHRPRGSIVHRPRGSIVHRPIGSNIHRPRGSVVHRPRGSVVHRPIGSNIHRPRGSIVHRPRGSTVHRPRGSIVHRPRGSTVHRPRGSIVHRPKGSTVHRPRGSIVHRPRGSTVHRPRGSIVHRPKGSTVHRPRGSIVHRPKGSTVHRPRGSIVHRPKGSTVHRPRGSIVHRPRGSEIHFPRGSTVHRPKGSKVHRPRGSTVHRPKGSRVHLPKGSIIRIPREPIIRIPREPVIRLN